MLLHIDRPVYRLTRGRHTFTSLVTGLPVAMLTTTGAKSGRQRTVPVLGLPTTDGLVVIASNYGGGRHPAWYHNLRRHPEGEVAVDGASRAFLAHEAEGEERERIWARALEIYPGFSRYEHRASHRRIGVFVLDPQ